MWGGESERHTGPSLAFLKQLEVRSPAPTQKNGRHRSRAHFPNQKKRPKYRYGESSTGLVYSNAHKFINPSYIHRASQSPFLCLIFKNEHRAKDHKIFDEHFQHEYKKEQTKQIEKRNLEV